MIGKTGRQQQQQTGLEGSGGDGGSGGGRGGKTAGAVRGSSGGGGSGGGGEEEEEEEDATWLACLPLSMVQARGDAFAGLARAAKRSKDFVQAAEYVKHFN